MEKTNSFTKGDGMRKNLNTFIRISMLMLLLVACTATQSTTLTNGNVPGFWFGLWHGFIAPVTFIISLFPNELRIYAFPNAGLWYDFGFILGIGGFSGGIFAGSRRRNRD
jgi:Na+-driven multidrug efflux pump